MATPRLFFIRSKIERIFNFPFCPPFLDIFLFCLQLLFKGDSQINRIKTHIFTQASLLNRTICAFETYHHLLSKGNSQIKSTHWSEKKIIIKEGISSIIMRFIFYFIFQLLFKGNSQIREKSIIEEGISSVTTQLPRT